MTQICLALSGLVLRAVEHKKPIEQLFASLHKLQSQDNENIAVLELLTVLPEEVVEDQNVDRSIDPNSRAQFTREVHAAVFCFPGRLLLTNVSSLMVKSCFAVVFSASFSYTQSFRVPVAPVGT